MEAPASTVTFRYSILGTPMALWLGLTLLAITPAFAAASDLAGYGKLVTAIYKANNNARACDGERSCLGDEVSVTLTSDVLIVDDLPPLQFNAFLIVKGACKTGSTPRRCVVDGLGKRKIFTSTPVGGPLARLEVQSLTFRNASGGVFYQFWGDIIARQCTFTSNKGGVEIALGLEGGFPARRFQDCSFTDNAGRVITRGNEGARVYRKNGVYILKRCKVMRNTGIASQDGGAVSLRGAGSARVIDTEFSDNKAFGSGGAFSLNASSARFYRSSFNGNTANSKRGMDIDGTTNANSNTVVSFCQSSVKAPSSSATSSISFVSPGSASGASRVSLCDTTLPAGSKLNTAIVTEDCSVCTY